MDAIARLCIEHDIAITDEVYEEMVFERPHLRLAGREGMWERTHAVIVGQDLLAHRVEGGLGDRAARSPRR